MEITEDQFIKNIRDEYRKIENSTSQSAVAVTASCRYILESLVKFFFLKKFGETVSGKLFDAMSDERFASCFDRFVICDMHEIRMLCNDGIHSGILAPKDAKALSSRLQSCISAFEKELGIVQTEQPSASVDRTPPFSAEKERNAFWSVFDRTLRRERDPFHILHEDHKGTTYYGVVNRQKSFVNYSVSVDFLMREKRVRVNIYIRDDLPLFERLRTNRDEIEKRIGTPPEWILGGERNRNTSRIAYYIPINIGSDRSYETASKKIIPIIRELTAVCEKYSPNLFFDR